MSELTRRARVYVVNVDVPDNSRWLKDFTKISVPVLLDNNLSVSTQYDMHSRRGLPMGAMTGVPTMGFVIVDDEGTIQVMRANILFGQDTDYILAKLDTL